MGAEKNRKNMDFFEGSSGPWDAEESGFIVEKTRWQYEADAWSTKIVFGISALQIAVNVLCWLIACIKGFRKSKTTDLENNASNTFYFVGFCSSAVAAVAIVAVKEDSLEWLQMYCVAIIGSWIAFGAILVTFWTETIGGLFKSSAGRLGIFNELLCIAVYFYAVKFAFPNMLNIPMFIEK